MENVSKTQELMNGISSEVRIEPGDEMPAPVVIQNPMECNPARAALSTLMLVEERQRLARDLHDSVNQSIHSLVLFSETLVSTLDRDDVDRARQSALRLQDGARPDIK
jgi:signal transduction histidine kinase